MRVFCLVFILLTVSTISTFAIYKSTTTEGELQVTVTDQQERLIPTGKATLTHSNQSQNSKSNLPATSSHRLADTRNNSNQTFKSNISSKGIAVFKRLPLGSYELSIISAGFKPFSATLTIKEGLNEFKARLMVREVKETVEVQQNQQEQRLNDAFNEVLREEEILLLGNDVALDLRQRYGEDILFEIDGFMGGNLPPKEQIALIKIIKNTFDAEFHELGQTIVKITTKAGYGRMNGGLYLDFKDYRLNARNPFDTERLPNQDRSMFGIVSLPIVKEKVSLNAQVYVGGNKRRQNIIAKAPFRKVENSLNTSFSSLTSTVGLRARITENQNIKIEHEFEKTTNKNLGVGGLNLPDTGYSHKTQGHKIRFYSGGIFRNKYINDFKLAYSEANHERKPNTKDVGITVLGAFSAGGAGVDNTSANKKLRAASNLMFDYQKHLFKFGGSLECLQRKSNSNNDANGSFIFTDISSYLMNKPSIFRIREGTSSIEAKQTQLAFYVNDDIRLFKNLQVGLGLRFERQTNIAKSSNFSPRLSFTYSPLKDGKLVLRGGAGVFYDWFELSDLDYILSNDGREAKELIIDNPSFPNPFGAKGEIRETLPPNVHQRDAGLKNPYVITAQGAFNYRMSRYLKLEGVYTYRKGLRQFRSRDINAPLIIGGSRPTGDLGQVVSLSSSGNLVRHEFRLEASGSFKRRFFYFLNYMLASERADYGWKFGLPVNSNDLKDEWGFSNFDQRHYVYSIFTIIPFKNRNIRFVPTLRMSSAYPYTITTGKDDNQDAVFNDRPEGVPRNNMRGDWHKQIDLGFNWEFPFMKITDKGQIGGKTITLEASIENLFNRSNLKGFVGNKLSPFFGKPTFASQPRSIKLGLRFNFF